MDETQREVKEKSFQDRMAHIGRLSAGIGHNIMTPLSLVMMNADLLSMKLKDHDNLRSHVEEIIHQASLISKIAENMMWKVRAEEQINPTSIQFGDLVREDLDFWMGDMFFKHKLNKDFKINPHTPTIYGVPFHFTSFIDEWILTVIERARPLNGGDLSVRADTIDEDRIYIQFEDSLPLPPETNMKVLESGCTHPLSKELYPAMTRLLEQHPAEMKVNIPAGDGLSLSLTWTL